MKYIDKKVIGDAGEHYFAYWATLNLEWPCRRLDIDLGIDAQLEILDDENNTTGDFIAVQVKTVKKSKKIKSVSVSYDNLEYWESISIPVIVVYIELDTFQIYWIHVNDNNIEHLKKKALKNKTRTSILKFTNKLTKKSKSHLIGLLYPEPDLTKAIELIEEICQYSNKGLEAIHDDDQTIKPHCDLSHFEISIYSLDHVFTAYDKLKKILKQYTNMDLHIDSYIDEQCNYSKALNMMNTLNSDVTYFFHKLYKLPEQSEYLEDHFKQGDLHYKLQAMYDQKRYGN